MARPDRLLNRNFLLLWQGQFVSNLGNQAAIVATVFWIKDATESASLVGLLLLLTGLATVLLGPVGGTFADRYSRRNIILLSDLACGLATLALVGLMTLVPHSTSLIVVGIFAVITFITVLSAFSEPAISAAIPDLVPEARVATANSLSQLAFELSGFVGQASAGILYRLLGAPLLFLIDAFSFLYAAAGEAFISVPQHIPERSPRWQDQFAEFWGQLLAGFRYIWSTEGLRGLVLLSSLVGFFSAPILVLLPFYLEDFLKLSPDWYGYLLASYSLGTIAGYAVAGSLNLPGRLRAPLTLLGMCLEAICYLCIVLIATPLAALALAALAGSASGFVGINVMTTLQLTTPSAVRGRVFGLLATISASTAPLAAGLAGVVADLLGGNIPLLYTGCAGAMLLVTLALAANPSVRAFLAWKSESSPGAEPQGQIAPLN